MVAQNSTLNSFLNMPMVSFTIPIFQRNYAWKRKHCEQFLNDILALVNTSISNNVGDSSQNNSKREHFLGTICYQEHFNNNIAEYSIIDGQQRIITSMLLLKALSKHNKIDPRTKDDIDRIICNSRDSKLRLKPMAKDIKAFEEIMKDSISEGIKSSGCIKAISIL
ncbi:DUF262 domain-containing protein [Helicobacter sp. 16-1353]|uniref:DUF262 domain-containing protein n=1 Tax=Helicobacter sp. 16-1353 TaxID=2004996 RepID=UPI0011BF0E7D|nr:DUF262 domain-containing protein [Helicobacter sp. 16-1353]